MKTCFLSILASLTLSSAVLAQPTIDWYTIDCGGGTSSAGVFSLSGTIGQPDAGPAMTGGAFSLTGGFWVGGAGGPIGCDSIDFNNDGVSPDSGDIADFLSVFGGGPCSNDPNCNDIDYNNDGVAPDSDDIDALLRAFAGGVC